jgi:hypothetical protein
MQASDGESESSQGSRDEEERGASTAPPSVAVATLTWPSMGVKPNTWKSWGFGVLWDSRMFRAQQKGAKHLALGCSWFRWKGLET